MSKTPNDMMLASIKSRQQKRTEFGWGIMTADKYVATLRDHVGLDVCYHYASKGQTSFTDALEKASRTLVYTNQDCVVEEVKDSTGLKKLRAQFDLPKNTLMAFQHVLTTPRKDRDGDILRSEGAQLDPRMLLLWQHVPTLPIGKMVGPVDQTKDHLKVVSAIVDMNELSHDAAVMVDNDMGRFSHGFRAIEFNEIKGADKDTPAGFDVKQFEIMEESLVSVPSNVDAGVEEVLLSLVEGGKLTSPLMKHYGKSIREHRPTTVPVGIDLKITVNNKEIKDGISDRSSSGTSEETGGSSPEEADGTPSQKETGRGTAKESEDNVIREKVEPIEQEKIVDERDVAELEIKDVEKSVEPEESKAGRVLSKSNENKIRDAVGAIDDVIAMEIPRPAKATLREASTGLGAVLTALGSEEEKPKTAADSLATAVTFLMFQSTKEQRNQMRSVLDVADNDAKQKETAGMVRILMGTN